METDSPATTTFAQVLARTRAAAGLTQEELAERAELSVRAVSNLERGEASRPRRGTIDRLVSALGLAGADARRFTDVARGRPVRDDDADATPAGDGPAQLPTDLPDFTGRADELTRLSDLLSGDHAGVRIVVLGGGGGVGKTALAVRVAHTLRHRYPDGQLYADLAGSRTEEVDPGTALAGFLAALGDAAPGDGDDLDRRAARYRSLLAGRRVLVVLDDARDAAHVRPLLPAGPGSAVLVTSRNRLPDLAGARHLIVGELAGPDATELFARIAGPERVAREPAATARVVAACDQLPLADPRAAPFAGYDAAMAWYAAEWPSLDALLRKASSDRRVPAATAARFAALVTLYPFLRGDLVVLERGARHAAALAERAGDHLLAANAHKRLGYALVEQRRPDEATRHQDRALAAFRAAGDRAGEAGMLNSIGRRLLHEARSHPDRYADARQYLLGSLAVARETGRGTAQITALGNLGQLEHRAGRPDEAHAYLTEALALSQKLGAAQLETVVAGSLGGVLADLGHHTEAVRQHEHALQVSRALADRSRETVALRELAETYLVAGVPELAADCAGRALDLHGSYDGPDSVEADVRVALGRALAALGRRDEAREEWSRALPVLDAADPVGAAEVRALLSR